MKTSNWLLKGLLVGPGAALIAACGTGESDPDAGPGGDDPDADTPPNGEDPPEPAIYERGSIAPEVELMPEGEFQRFEMPDFDDNTPERNTFEVGNLQGNPGLAQRMDDVGSQIDADNEGSNAREVGNLVPGNQDNRAQNIPFRGKPSDVELIEIEDERFALVPLGGEISIPGNQVELIDVTDPNNAERVELLDVGIRPQKIAATQEIGGEQPGIAFVCNQYSNYISVIDIEEEELLIGGDGEPVEIPTEYQCTDLELVAANRQNPDAFTQDLYVANQWSGSVLKYELEFIEDANNNVEDVIRRDGEPDPEHTPSERFRDIGSNPMQLQLSDDLRDLYVANSRGGDAGRIDLDSGDQALERYDGPAISMVDAQQSLFVLTTTIHRGYPSEDEANILPSEVTQPGPVVHEDTGQEVHHGPQFNDTVTYNFEDLRNQILQTNLNLDSGAFREYTDVVEADQDHFNQAGQRIIEGAVGADMIRGGDQGNDVTEVFVAWKGSDEVQGFEVDAGDPTGLRLRDGDFLVDTDFAPKALAFDEDERELFVANWSGETLQIFDVDGNNELDTVELEYFAPAYPATDIEIGEWGFLSAEWSNDGTKSCVSCHTDELLADGLPYANGTRAPTIPNQVIPNWNLHSTPNYFWNNSFDNNSYLSLAFTAQSRGPCENAIFGFVEGAGTVALDDRDGVGDGENRIVDFDNDNIIGNCLQEIEERADGFDVNDDFIGDIAGRIVDERNIVTEAFLEDVTLNEIGEELGRAELAAFIDWYGAAWHRLPPNPTHFLHERGLLDEEESEKIDQGRENFETAGCVNCHIPEERFQDEASHGPGRTVIDDIINDFEQDMIIDGLLAGQDDQLPEQVTRALARERSAGGTDQTPNIHTELDLFVPFCFDEDLCLEFEHPDQANDVDDALEVLTIVNLNEIERGFIPGNPTGNRDNAKITTPSIMGAWWQPNYMRHGFARSIVEGIVGPEHEALSAGQIGYAVNDSFDPDTHGETSGMSEEDVEAIVEYVNSIQFAE